jgi:hypothetical protein
MNLFRKKKNNHIAWKIAGGAALALAATALIRNYSDIKRYIKMSMM